MKKLFLIACVLMALPGLCRTLVVGKGQPYVTIRTAVVAAQDGDTVLVKKGTYYINNIFVTKSIALIGENYPLLHGADKYEIFTVSGKDITIKGFHFTNSGYSAMNDFASVKIVDASNIFFENNRITNAYFGVHVANSHHFTIRNNYFKGLTKSEQTTGNGIHLWKCNKALIENNEMHGHRDGIYFEFVTQSLIQKNLSEGNIRYGLHFMFSNDNWYVENTFKNNGAGVAVMYSKLVTMLRNHFDSNWGAAAYGLLLKEISDSKIEHNTFFQNTVGIYMEGTNRINVTNNVFRANGWAAKVQASCMDNTFFHNNFLANTFDVGTNGSLVMNTFNNNYWDKYEGYDMNKDGFGDVAYHPVSMYSTIVENSPNTLMLLRSFMVSLLDKAERAIPSLTPENLRDDQPLMKALKLNR
jgi:nitrous oxidase accessory protein